MKKKIALGLIALVAVVGGVAAMSAYEAHVINVTAKIENALTVPTTPIEFGTVFPQEYVEEEFTIGLSQSFLDENQLRRGDVEYKIEQKPKCIDDSTGEHVLCVVGADPNNPTACACPVGTTTMPDLCRFLSKISIDSDNDTSVPSYYVKASDTCVTPSPEIASGYLVKCHPAHVVCAVGDITDCWKVDLKVPPVAGSVGQDWPASCAGYTVPIDGAVYGCDLWIEVTGLSDLEEPPVEPSCGDGWITPPEECDSGIGCGMFEYCDDITCTCHPIPIE